MESNMDSNVDVLEIPQAAADAAMEHVDNVRKKILHILAIYPKVSPSMLQVAIGPNISPAIWHPIVEDLVIKGEIDRTQVQATTPAGRTQVYTIISIK